MTNYFETTVQALLDLAAVLGSTNWTSPKVHLNTQNFIPNQDNVVADLTANEATFVGYAAAAITFSSPYVDGAGNVVATGTVHFAATSNATPNAIYNMFVTNTAGTLLLAAGNVDGAPIPISNSGDGFTLVVTVQLGGGSSTVVG